MGQAQRRGRSGGAGTNDHDFGSGLCWGRLARFTHGESSLDGIGATPSVPQPPVEQ
ncbi:hypothetical protein DB30_00582 [Enhygromyxa salina]|uniref:Uncharacterized protein n=1 Tax=Enhygromyxa salina TaxID=215803 RepID=A0A0C2CZ23_9BACT|nr:hypothetical protein DB30_00582 [Enhygromyxa salina]